MIRTRHTHRLATALLAFGLLLVPAFAGAAPETFGSEHGLVRTAVLQGDYLGLPTQTGSGPRFGSAIAIDGDWMLVGAPGMVHDSGIAAANHGGAFLFRRQGSAWTLHMRITYRPGTNGDGSDTACGHAVALHLPWLFVGCPGHRPDGTTVTGGLVVGRIVDPAVVFNAVVPSSPLHRRCGEALAVSANHFALGCPGAAPESPGGTLTIYSFDPTVSSGLPIGGQLIYNIANQHTGARHGAALALVEALGQPARLFVGLPEFQPTGSPRSGVVHVHTFLGYANFPPWSSGQQLAPSPANAGARFGEALAANRTQLVIGAPGDYCPGSLVQRCGRVFRYQRSGSSYLAQESGIATNAPGGHVAGPHSGMRFGDPLALLADFRIAIGAPATHGTWALTTGQADEVGLVEIRGAATDYNVNSYRGVLRPAPLSSTQIDGGRFGTAMASDVSNGLLAVGYPLAGSTLPTVNRRGQVWIYQPDRIFGNGFQAP